MYESHDNLIFLQKRAEQLFWEGDAQGALRLVESINAQQSRKFEETVNLLALERAEC